MKTIIKYTLAALVIVALALMLALVMLWLMYCLLLAALFETGFMYFLIGAVFTGIATWAALRIFDRHKVYSLEEGVHYEN